jgi:hypothetical protein
VILKIFQLINQKNNKNNNKLKVKETLKEKNLVTLKIYQVILNKNLIQKFKNQIKKYNFNKIKVKA